ncbi:MAG: hypothetical protein HQL08_16390 [Nitrospirae bacterium]|nr:hypothetical protein [Nitrospirota bacterium]
MAEQNKKSLKAIAADIAEGYVSVNPLFLKPFNEESLKSLYSMVSRIQIEIRTAPFPYNEIEMIRERSLRLQRLYAALNVIKNFAREKKYKFL